MANRHFHDGELTFQNKMGMREQIDRAAEIMMRDHMPDQHREFFAGLEYVFLATVGVGGRPFASILTRPAGFAVSPEPHVLRIAHPIDRHDPAFAALVVGSPIGVLGLDFTNRRRNRMHGKISRIDQNGFDITVAQSYGNCPKYISTREITDRIESTTTPMSVERDELSPDDIALITAADTFFIASHRLDGSGAPYEGADMSHRGGNPGFVQVEGANRLVIPDYKGNNLFNTLGNLAADPAAALLFVDFKNGDLLHLTGNAQIVEGSEEVSLFPGAKRLLKINVTQARQTPAGCDLRWALLEASPFNPTS